MSHYRRRPEEDDEEEDYYRDERGREYVYRGSSRSARLEAPRHTGSGRDERRRSDDRTFSVEGGYRDMEDLALRGRPRSRSPRRYSSREEDVYRSRSTAPYPDDYDDHRRRYATSVDARGRSRYDEHDAGSSRNRYDRRSLSPRSGGRGRWGESYYRDGLPDDHDSFHRESRYRRQIGEHSYDNTAMDTRYERQGSSHTSRRSADVFDSTSWLEEDRSATRNTSQSRYGHYSGQVACQEPTQLLRPPSSSSFSSIPTQSTPQDLSFSSTPTLPRSSVAPKPRITVNIDHNPRSAITNIIPAEVTRNFHFYLYGISFSSKRVPKDLDGNASHGKLFYASIEESLREKAGYTQAQIDDLLRVIFFEGASVFASRKIPGFDKHNLPQLLYENEEGEKCIITSCEVFRAPASLQRTESPVLQDAVDFRCANCTNSFASQQSLISHCLTLGHVPVVAPELNMSEEEEVPTIESIRPAAPEVFLSFCNIALQRALSERLARWGKDFIDSTTFTTPTNRHGKSLGVRVFRAFRCEFAIGSVGGKDTLTLCIDINAKIIRTTTILDAIYRGRDPRTTRLDDREVAESRQKWLNEQVVCVYDKKTYTVVDILFDRSPATMPVNGLNISHADYFEKKKGITLEYPNTTPLLQVYGWNKSTIYFPAELVCGNQFDTELKSQLPEITSFTPKERNDAIDEIKRYLKLGAQKSKKLSGLLPAVGVVLAENRVNVSVDVLSLPEIILSKMPVPRSRGGNWGPIASKASFHVEPGRATLLNVILVYNKRLYRNRDEVYSKLVSMVNGHCSSFRLPTYPYASIEAGDLQHHWEAVEQYFRSERNLPNNVFLIDFNQPPRGSSTDPAYPVIKEFLSRHGYLSQFVNFNSNSHTNKDRRSHLILGAVGRQILNKCGARIWWVNIPRSIPVPAMFVGVDVFHAPRRYDARLGKYFAKESVAGVVVQLIRRFDDNNQPVYESFSKTERRKPGGEYELGIILEDTVEEALRRFNVTPSCCICWRDGVGDAAIAHVKNAEIPALRKAVMNISGSGVPIAYVVCQKRISTKFISMNGTDGMPPGALIKDVGSVAYETFYVHGPSPSISTPRSIRYLIVERDEMLKDANLPELAWALAHDYPNWTGPIKVPSVVQLAHKLAEMAGNFADCGQETSLGKFSNSLFFL